VAAVTGRLDLRIDGPFSDDYTIDVVWGIAEAVRVVSHSTLSPSGLTRPQTVHAASTALHLTAMRLEATLKQLAGFLGDQHHKGRLAVAAAEDTTAAEAVVSAQASLARAGWAAGLLKGALGDVAVATGGLVAAVPPAGAAVGRQ
jgi:hypothetical protein